MSVDASIHIHLSLNTGDVVNIGSIITALVDYGWTVDSEGGVYYSILDTADNFLSIREPIDIDTLTSKLEAQRASCKVINIEINWQKTGISGLLYFYNSGTMFTFSPEVTRKRLPPDDWYGMTDFQWYLPKLIPPLHKKFGIKQFECQHIH